MLFNHLLNFSIAFGWILLATAAINGLTGYRLELHHVAPFVALWHAVKHNPPPFKD